MNIVFNKKQIEALKEEYKQAVAVSNSEHDGDSSSFMKDFNDANQHNMSNSDMLVNTSDFGGKSQQQVGNSNNGGEMTIKNGPGVAANVKKIIDTSKNQPQTAPSQVRIVNGVEKGNNLVEVTTFKKKDLDKFLKSL